MTMMMMVMPSCAFTIPTVKIKHPTFLQQNFIINGNKKVQPLQRLHQSVRDTSDDTTMETITSSSNTNSKTLTTRDDMPWSTNQEYSLQDKLPQYTINIPNLNSPTLKGGGSNKSTFVLWYTMRKEVVDFMGYDIDFLRLKYAALLEQQQQQQQQEENEKETNEIPSPPGVLPYIDAFEFRTNGGIQRKVYGLIGIEPGTQIVTSPLKDIELTLSKGFVLTEDGSCAYELGIPKSESKFDTMMKGMNNGDENSMENDPYSIDLSALAKDGGQIVSSVGKESGRVAESVVKGLGDPETSQMIVNLGATTAVVLGAATAMNMLSHHLTVNVFWV